MVDRLMDMGNNRTVMNELRKEYEGLTLEERIANHEKYVLLGNINPHRE